MDPAARRTLDGDPEFSERLVRVRYRKHFPATSDEAYWAMPYLDIEWDLELADAIDDATRLRDG